MPPLRPIPVLVAGAACIALAACGGDDPPAPEAAAPTQAQAQTQPQTAPAETASRPATTTASGGDGASSDKLESGDRGEEADSTAPDSTAAPRSDTDSGDADTQPKSSPDAPKPDPSSKAQGQQTPASPLKDYAKGGVPATKDEAAKIRAALIGFQEALARRDPVAVCALTVGLPVRSDSKTPMSCTSLTAGAATKGPTEQNRKLVAESKVVVSDDKATAELTAGFLMPLRKIDGRWRIDYAAINNPGGSTR